MQPENSPLTREQWLAAQADMARDLGRAARWWRYLTTGVARFLIA